MVEKLMVEVVLRVVVASSFKNQKSIVHQSSISAAALFALRAV